MSESTPPLEWQFEILDKMSGSAGRMAKQLAQVDKILGQLGGSAHKAEKHTESFGLRLLEFKEIGEGAYEVLHKIGEKAFEFAHEAVAAISFKQNALIALDAILGSHQKAEEVLEFAERIAKRTGLQASQMQDFAKALAAAGASVPQIEALLPAIADLGQLRGPEGMQAFASILAEVESVGYGTERQIKSLAAAGVSGEKVYQHLAEIFGLSADSMAELKAGLGQPIPKEGFILATLQALQDMEKGPLGNLAVAGGQTLSGQIARLGGGLERAFESLVGGPGLKAFQGMLENLITIFQPDGLLGRGIRELVNGPLADFFKQFSGAEGLKRLRDDFAEFLGILKATGEALKEVLYILATPARLGAQAADSLPKHTLDSDFTKQELQDMARGTLADPKASPAAREKAKQIMQRGVGPVSVNIHVEANGAGRDDADSIAHAIRREVPGAIAAALEGMAIEGGQA